MSLHELDRKMARGAGWMVVLQLCDRSIGLVSTVILARLLLPADFGLVAMAMSIVAIVELLRALGFETALIQNQAATRPDYDTAWTLNISLSLVIAAILTVLAGPAELYYDEQRMGEMLLVIAASQLILGFQNIGVVAFRKELSFHKEFWFQFQRRLFAFIVTVSAAVILRNYWALLIGMVSRNVYAVVSSYLMHSYRPKFSFASAKSLIAFSKWLLADQSFNVVSTRSVHFIVGRVLNPASVGLFTVAYELATLPTTSLLAPINRALFPGYAKMSHDLALLRRGVLNVLGAIYSLAIPAGIGIALVAEYLVPALLGERWTEAIPLLEVLAISGSLVAARANFATSLIAMGRPKVTTAVSAVHAILLVPTLIATVHLFGLVGAAFAYLSVEGLLLAVRYVVMMKVLQIVPASLVSRIWRPVTSSLGMAAGISLGVKPLLAETTLPALLMLLICVLSGALIYASSSLLLWLLTGRPDGPESFIMRKLRPGQIADDSPIVD